MKTVSEVAKELNVTTQLIYRKINKTYKKEMLAHVHNKNGNKYIDDGGIKILKNNVANTLQTDEERKELKEKILFLENELSKEREHNREQANKFANLAEQMADLTRNNQILLKQEQDKNNLQSIYNEKSITNINKQKSNIIKRFFENKK